MRISLPVWAGLSSALLVAAQQSNDTQWPVLDNGYTKDVQWDHYSLIVKGQRTFVWSGEFHYWRIPVPEVWTDLLQKVKAAGFNTVSVYVHWGFHAASPSPDSVDFKRGARNVGYILELAKQVGLYVTFRNGPYVNAETTAGGFALWTTTGAYGGLRDNDPRYTAAWEPFMTAVNQIATKHQMTDGGSILLQQIENEIAPQRRNDGSLNTPLAEYMVALENNTRQNDIIIPLITNAPNMGGKSWSKDYKPGPGAQDIYGVDSYPACWSCDLTECGQTPGNPVFETVSYYEHFNQVSPRQPSFIPEFQGGAYNPWGGPEGGCGSNSGTDFVSVQYRHLVAQRLTMASLYMLYGGTNWGGLATNVVATSYDYSAPIQEGRQISAKFYETKLVGLFLRAAEDLTVTDRVGQFPSYTDTTAVIATELRNPETQAGFYVVKHTQTRNTSTTDFHLRVSTTVGNFTIPQFSAPMRLVGRTSKIAVTDFHFNGNTLGYSTAEVLSHSVVDGKSILALWLPSGESGEFSILGGSKRRAVVSGTGGGFHIVGDDLVLSYKQQSTQCVIEFDNFRVFLLPQTIAYRFWAPTLTLDPVVKANEVVFVTGPYLVRTIALSGSVAAITGDIDEATVLEVFAPAQIASISWNGKPVDSQKTSYGSLKVSLKQPGLTAEALQKTLSFGDWKYSNALPETSAAYDDSKWVLADHTTTPNPTKPQTLPVLYSDDYGFHTGVQLYRGRFSANASAVKLNVQGGTAFGWSAWLNGEYLGGFEGSATAASNEKTLPFGDVEMLEENVLTVVMDHSGHNQRAEALFPRGILGATLIASSDATFSSWKVAGNAGGQSNIDPVRGPIAEGGLHAERLGWHLPGFDDSKWETRSPSAEGSEGGSIGFFRTTTKIDVPKGYDVTLELILSSPEGSNLRAQIYVNGYQYGKYVPQVGNQIAFPIPPGIINMSGESIIAIGIWSQDPAEAGPAKVGLYWKVLGVYESAWSASFDASYLQPGWSEDRLNYA